MRIATWNVNSIRTRLERVLAWCKQTNADILCLQETKALESQFPFERFEQAGYHAVVFGQKAYNGVAILSKKPLRDVQIGFGDKDTKKEARVVAGTIDVPTPKTKTVAKVTQIRITCVYVPNGQTVGSEKWIHKLSWLRQFEQHLKQEISNHSNVVVCGDFNVAPTDLDVAEPETWRETVLCHKDVRARFEVLCSLGLIDIFRQVYRNEEKIYSWWDYRHLAFPKNRGLRIDLHLVTKELSKICSHVFVDREARKGTKPSDHAPVVADFSL